MHRRTFVGTTVAAAASSLLAPAAYAQPAAKPETSFLCTDFLPTDQLV